MEELALCAADTERACDEGNKQMDKLEGSIDKVSMCVHACVCACVCAYACVYVSPAPTHIVSSFILLLSSSSSGGIQLENELSALAPDMRQKSLATLRQQVDVSVPLVSLHPL